MRIVTKEIKVYSVDDVLNMPELKEKVFENYRDFNVDFQDWHDFIFENWKEKLEGYGFISPEINYSGFWSQGDGASFTCYRIDLPVFLKNFAAEIDLTEKQKSLLLALMEKYYIFGFDVKRCSCRYYHENTVFVDDENCLYDFVGYSRLYAFLEGAAVKVKNAVAGKVVDLSREIYCDLRKEYEYLTSEEGVFESLRCNEYEFSADGKIFID